MSERADRLPRRYVGDRGGVLTVEGWKGIALYLLRGTRTVQRYDLPVRRDGASGRVWIPMAELDGAARRIGLW